jgi:hypothetical protein
VTAVQGNEPMKDPRKQSETATPQTPHAMLMPDHGITPMRRKTDSLTQAEDLFFVPNACRSVSASPSKAARVISRVLGKKWVKNGAKGADSIDAHTEPIVVKSVRSSVAKAGENRAPANTFYTSRDVYYYQW